MFLRPALPLVLLSVISLHAQSVWQATTNKTWSTSGNWSGGVPNSDTAIAQFGATSQPDVNVTGTLTVDRIEFTADAPAYTFAHKNGSTLTLSGDGIVNASSATQTFELKSNKDAAARIAFVNSASAGNAAISAQGTSTYSGLIDFSDTSSAGTAQLKLLKYGSITFDGTATAANAKITFQDTGSVVTFQGASTAASAEISVTADGSLVFSDYSSAGFAKLLATYAPETNARTAPAQISFTGNATADSATIDSTRLDFSGSASAGNATLTLRGATYFKDSSTAGSATLYMTGGGGLTFSDQSSLGSANVILSNSAGIKFEGNATAGTGVISGVGSLHVDTDGTFILSGEHTYSGTTKVTDGQLVVNGSLPNTEMVEVFHSKTLGGSGTIGGLVALHPFARLDPGDSVGTLTIAGGLLLTGYSIVNFELGTQSDLIRLTGGTFSYAPIGGNPVTLNLFNSGGFDAGTYTLIDFTTGDVELSNIDINNFILGTIIEGFDYSLAFTDDALRLIATSTAIPEPSTYAAFFGLVALGFCVFRKRRAR
jgi:PEP-CTERM putative exosortase interaction domain/autotransporter-associated beta strand repeat